VASAEAKQVRDTLEDIKAGHVNMNTLGDTIVSILQLFDARAPHRSDTLVKAKSDAMSTKLTNQFWVYCAIPDLSLPLLTSPDLLLTSVLCDFDSVNRTMGLIC